MMIKCMQVRPAEAFELPSKSYPGDAGFDFYISRDTVVYPGTFAQVPTNCALAIPQNYWGLLLGRSSTFFKRNLLSHQGTIDAGYRGEIVGAVYNPTDKRVVLHAGERVFQLIIMPLKMQNQKMHRIYHCAKLPKGERDTRGFGSTGGFKS